MSPKRVNSAQMNISGPAEADWSKRWEELTAAALDEENWKACISLVVADSVEDEFYISALKQAVQQPLRKLFSLLSWEHTLEKVSILGNPKTKKTKDVPAFYEVTESAKAVLDAGDELSLDMKAKLIKFQLLAIKNKDLEKKAALEMAMQNSSPKDKGGAAKKETSKKASVSLPKEPTFIDDEPVDGPQHYILITAFQQADLISALDSLGVHVSNVVRLRSDRGTNSIESKVVHSPARSQSGRRTDSFEGKVVLETHHSTSGENAETLKLAQQQELDLFWKQLDGVLNSGSVGSKLYDVVILDYSVDKSLLRLNADTPGIMTLGADVFDGVAHLLYDTMECMRQHQHYLSSLKLIPVPLVSRREDDTRIQVTTEAAQDIVSQMDESSALSTEVDMRLYCNLLDDFPSEVVSVPLIIHCMLEQVEASEEEAQHYLKQQSDLTEREDLGMKGDKMKGDKRHPTILYHHDKTAQRLHQLPATNRSGPADIEAAMMKKNVALKRLMSRFKASTCYSMATRHELIHLCSDDSQSPSEVEKLFQLCVFENMPLTAVDQSECLTAPSSDPLSPLLWDDPTAFTHHLYGSLKNTQGPSESRDELQDQSDDNVITIADLQKSLTRRFRDWTSTERHDPNTFPQIFQEVLDTYRCVDTFSSSHDSTVFIFCHNPMSPNRSSRESWDVALHTDVRFRNYMEHVAKTISDWTRQEEKKREEQQKRETESSQSLDKETPEISAVPEPYAFTGYSMNGRLLHVKGEIQHIYPSDGGHISVNRVQHVEGSTQLTVCVEKDGHCFYMHVTEQGEMERCVCFNAVLHNGIRISYSRPLLIPLRDPEDQTREDCESVLLNVSIPTGLLLCFRTGNVEDDSGDQDVLIKQVLPAAGSGSDWLTSTELSRTITCQGTVIKTMRDGATEVLFADGTVSSSPDSGPVCVLVQYTAPQDDPIKDTTLENKDEKDKGKGTTESIKEESKESMEKTGGSWTTTDPSGYRVATVSGERVEVAPILSYQDTDPNTQNVVISREDLVLSVLYADGRRIVDHADGTRISTFFQQREPSKNKSSAGSSSEGTIEKLVKVERSGFAPVTVNCKSRSFEVLLGDGTIVRAKAQGSYEVCPYNGGMLHIQNGVAIYNSEPCETGPKRDQPAQYVMCQGIGDLCHVTDAEGHLYQVNTDGVMSVFRSETTPENTDSEKEMELQHNVYYNTHPPRLFVLSLDGSATELLSVQVVEKVLMEAKSDASVVVIKESLPDKRDVNTLVKALSGEGLSYWILPDDIVSANHNFSWETVPISETPGPPSEVSLGEGLELEEKVQPASGPAAVLLVPCPDTLLVRQITQNPPVPEELYEKLQETLLVYVKGVLQREKLKEELMLNESCTEEKNIRQANILQLVLSRPVSEKGPAPVNPVFRASPFPRSLKAGGERLQEEKQTNRF